MVGLKVLNQDHDADVSCHCHCPSQILTFLFCAYLGGAEVASGVFWRGEVVNNLWTSLNQQKMDFTWTKELHQQEFLGKVCVVEGRSQEKDRQKMLELGTWKGQASWHHPCKMSQGNRLYSLWVWFPVQNEMGQLLSEKVISQNRDIGWSQPANRRDKFRMGTKNSLHLPKVMGGFGLRLASLSFSSPLAGSACRYWSQQLL